MEEGCEGLRGRVVVPDTLLLCWGKEEVRFGWEVLYLILVEQFFVQGRVIAFHVVFCLRGGVPVNIEDG